MFLWLSIASDPKEGKKIFRWVNYYCMLLLTSFFAPAGALLVMMRFHRPSNFFNFHSVHWDFHSILRHRVTKISQNHYNMINAIVIIKHQNYHNFHHHIHNFHGHFQTYLGNARLKTFFLWTPSLMEWCLLYSNVRISLSRWVLVIFSSAVVIEQKLYCGSHCGS